LSGATLVALPTAGGRDLFSLLSPSFAFAIGLLPYRYPFVATFRLENLMKGRKKLPKSRWLEPTASTFWNIS
jgi:hypothetical protein